MRARSTLGAGSVSTADFGHWGEGSVLEDGVRAFHPERIWVGEGVYVGHDAFLHGYHAGSIRIEAGAWLGPRVYLHGAGHIHIGREAGIGPGVHILTSQHRPTPEDRAAGRAVLDTPLAFAPVAIEDGADVGAGSLILPGVRIGAGAIVGGGAVVTRDVAPGTTVVGNPARSRS